MPFREIVVISTVLVLCLCAAFPGVVFDGRSLVYTDNFNFLDDRPLATSYGPGFIGRETWTDRNLLLYPNFHDPGATWWQWEPGGVFLRNRILNGELPFWDPYVAAGTPAMANLTQAFFFPPYFVMVALGNTSALKNAYFLLLLFAAALSTHVLMRKHGVSVLASLFAALAFMFCGGLNQNVGSFIGQTTACMPMTLLVTRWFLDRPGRVRLAAVSMTYAGVALASFPPVLLAQFALVEAYVIWSVVRDSLQGRPDWWRHLALHTLGAVIAVGLVAWYYLPFRALLAVTDYVSTFYQTAALEELYVYAGFQLLSPFLMGGGKVFASPPMPQLHHYTLPYVGIVAMLTASFAAFSLGGKRRVLLEVMMAAAVVAGLKVLGWPPIHWISYLPVLKSIHFAAYFGILINFAIAVLAGLGIESLISRMVSFRRGLVVLVGATGAMAFLYRLAELRGALTHPEARSWVQEYWEVAAIGLVVLALVAITVTAGRTHPKVALTCAFVVLLALVGEGIDNTAYPRQQRWDIWRHPPPYVTELREHAGFDRVLHAVAFEANAGSAFEVFDLGSHMTFNSERTYRLYQRYTGSRGQLFLRIPKELPPDPVLDRANVKHVILTEALPALIHMAEERGYDLWYRDGWVRIYSRPCPPRYFFSSNYRVVDPESALAAVGKSDRKVIIELRPEFDPSPDHPDDPPVEIVKFGCNRYRLSIRAPRAGLVYMSESFAPGWSATVNGTPTDVLRANFAFRAVEVPAGDVEIEMSYWPPGLTSGLIVSLFSIVALAAAVAGRGRWMWTPAGRECGTEEGASGS